MTNNLSPVFIDTSAFIARVLSDDDWHAEAASIWEKLKHATRPLYSSEHVLDESATLISRRCNYTTGSEWAQRHLQSKKLTWLQSTTTDLVDASILMKKYSDHKVSFTDCISAVLMKRERCKEIFTFDSHFKLMGFKITENT